MRYYEVNDGIYVLCFGIGGNGGQEISKERYDQLRSAVDAAPKDTETVTHRLTVDLEWEPVEIDPVNPPEELTADEIAAAIEEALA